MYGLVNRAIEDLITMRFGEERWDDVLEAADVDMDGFVSVEQYDDQVTYKLVGAVSSVLEVDAAQFLEELGEYWTLYTGQAGYGSLMTWGGSNLEEFLGNLNALHERAAASFENMTPPRFDCEHGPDGTLILHYRSERPGLTPMVVGLLKGLAKRFSMQVEIQARQGEDGHDIFDIRKVAAPVS